MSNTDNPQTEHELQALFAVPYADFVSGLFVKPVDDLPGQLHHATTGIIGELVELWQAKSRVNEIEELGDLEFYFQAFCNVHSNAGLTFEVPASTKFETFRGPLFLDVILKIALEASAELLDQTKKGWIYAKPLGQLGFGTPLRQLRLCLEAYYKLSGLDYQTVVNENKLKLVKRYPGGKYSDKAAQERADKQTA